MFQNNCKQLLFEHQKKALPHSILDSKGIMLNNVAHLLILTPNTYGSKTEHINEIKRKTPYFGELL